MSCSEYLLGDASPEINRLRVQHRLWASESHRTWRDLGIGPGDRVLDIGAGPGFCTLELADWVGATGEVIGFDQSARFLSLLSDDAQSSGFHNIRTIAGDADQLDLPTPVDAAFARWSFCFFNDPEAVLARLANVIRPGGRLGVIDYCNYRAFAYMPRPRVMSKVVATIESAWADSGGILDIMEVLPTMAARQGFRIDGLRAIERAVQPGEALWYWPKAFLEGFLPRLVAEGRLDTDDPESILADITRLETIAGSWLSLPTMLAMTATRI